MNHQEPSTTSEGVDATVVALFEPMPVRSVSGWTYSRTLADWAERNGFSPPDEPRPKSTTITGWLLDVVGRNVTTGALAKPAARHAANRLITEWVQRVAAVDDLGDDWSPRLARNLATENNAQAVFASVVQAVNSGAGLGEYAEHPASMLGYAAKVREGA